MSAIRKRLSGHRWHLQHGPIDLVIGADGRADAVAAAHEHAWQRFGTVLEELVQELHLLRQPVDGSATGGLRGPVAQRMWAACRPLARHGDGFITPMAAVAGSVAQEIMQSYQRPGIERAWVNNGGDIALHLAAGQTLRVGLFADVARLGAPLAMRGGGALPIDGRFELPASAPVRGVATSGWRGRSFSLGIADSVTVLAETAAAADAAATVIANHVNIDDARVVRRPANQLKDDSDLGARAVTVDVPPLPSVCVRAALASGLAKAVELQAARLIDSAVLVCQQRFAATRGFDVACVEAPLVRIPDAAPRAPAALLSS